ncbi:MAG: hypothetical protein H5T66_05345 [Chloroflexi bacterium]|nr:hypothetical protein [Chloroflexota bacterium]
MRKDVGLEETAIAQYRAHIEAIDDDHVRLVLSRILHDEQAHKGIFEGLAEAVGQGEAVEVAGEAPSAPAKPPGRLIEILNQGVRHEYTVILQYLYHSFVAEDMELAEGLQNAAINEMQHMGWLSEEVAEKGAQPEMSHTELFLSRDPVQNLEADIAVEREVTKAYSTQIPEIEEEGVRQLVERIRDHEIFHDGEFSYLLKEVQEAQESEGEEESKPKPPPEIPSVGSLLGKP